MLNPGDVCVDKDGDIVTVRYYDPKWDTYVCDGEEWSGQRDECDLTKIDKTKAGEK